MLGVALTSLPASGPLPPPESELAQAAHPGRTAAGPSFFCRAGMSADAAEAQRSGIDRKTPTAPQPRLVLFPSPLTLPRPRRSTVGRAGSPEKEGGGAERERSRSPDPAAASASPGLLGMAPPPGVGMAPGLPADYSGASSQAQAAAAGKPPRKPRAPARGIPPGTGPLL